MRNISFSSHSCNSSDSSDSSDSVASDGTSVQGVTSILNDTKGRDMAKDMVERFENLHLGSARVPPSQDSAPVNGNLRMPGENSDNSQKKFEDPGLFIRRQNAIVQVFTREDKREKKNREQPSEHHSDKSQDPLVGKEPGLEISQQAGSNKDVTPKKLGLKTNVDGQNLELRDEPDPNGSQDQFVVNDHANKRGKKSGATVVVHTQVPPVESQQGRIARIKTSCLNLFQRCFGRAPR